MAIRKMPDSTECTKYIFVLNSPRGVEAILDWHNLFLWECKSMMPMPFGPHGGRPDTELNVPEWRLSQFSALEWIEGLNNPLCDPWGKRYNDLSISTSDKYPFATFRFERPSNIPHLHELTEIQEACEKNISKIKYRLIDTIENTPKLLMRFSSSKRMEVERAQQELPKVIEETNRYFARLQEIRNEILGNMN